MSINYCTISNTSLDAFCGNRRQIVLNRLIAELHPPIPVSRKSGNPAHVKYPIPAVRRDERWEQPTITPIELDKIVVTAEFNGLLGSSQQDIDGRLDLVYVTDLEFAGAEVSVNISAIKFNE